MHALVHRDEYPSPGYLPLVGMLQHVAQGEEEDEGRDPVRQDERAEVGDHCNSRAIFSSIMKIGESISDQ